MMERQLVHLIRLVDDLLDVSRVRQGKIELRKEKIEAADAIRSALETSRPLIEAGGHELETDLAKEPIWLEADLTRLSQVVSNLLNNAARYTPDRGRIALSLKREGEEAVIAVTDSGVGVAAERQAEIFQLFAQVDNRPERGRGGLGIGLALVKQLTDLHGGSVEVRSEGAGKGSTFTVRLPIASPPLAEAAATDAQAAAAQPLKVLVVDDNEAVAQTVGWMLEAIGHDYQIVHSGREALAAAPEYLPDAILLDIGLPGMDGYAVCRALRQEDAFKRTPIIAQTGWGQDSDKAEAAAAGFDHHLVKPIALAQLERLLAGIEKR
jgi:CheY-like chemotaxis protein